MPSGSPIAFRGGSKLDDGRVVAAGFGEDSDGVMGGSTVRLGHASVRLTNVALPLLREDPTWVDGTASFQQTFGGRTSAPAPRTVGGAPYIRVIAPWVWTTLRLEAPGRRGMPGLAGRGEPFSSALGLRPGGAAGVQERADRLRRVDASLAAKPNPLGRCRLAGDGHRGRVGSRTAVVQLHHERCRQAACAQVGRRREPHGAGSARHRCVPGARRLLTKRRGGRQTAR